jgi:hypothetical protein
MADPAGDPMITFPGSREAERLTAEAFDDPQVGDRFHEMCSFWMYVLAVEPDGRIAVMHASPPCTVPDDGKVVAYASHDEYRKAYAYGSIPGYSMDLANRGSNVAGWFKGWPDVEQPSVVEVPESCVTCGRPLEVTR